MTLRRGLLLTCAATTLFAQEVPYIDHDAIRRAVDEARRVQDKIRINMDKTRAEIDIAVEQAVKAQTNLWDKNETFAYAGPFKGQGWATAAIDMAFSMQAPFQNSKGRAPLTADEEMKIMAIESVMQSDAERAIPLVDKIVQNQQASMRLRLRALQALGHSSSPKAREVVMRVAKDSSNTELQSRAIQLLGEREGAQNSQLLGPIYNASTNLDIKRQVIRAWASADAKEQLLGVAKSDANAELRSHAVRHLGGMRASAELAGLYGSEASPEVRKDILRGIRAADDWQKLIDIAKTESNEELRNRAIQQAGSMRATGVADALVAMYGSTTDTSTRGAILQSLSQERNAKQLIALARKETDPELKRTALQHLTRMKGDEVTTYLTELLQK